MEQTTIAQGVPQKKTRKEKKYPKWQSKNSVQLFFIRLRTDFMFLLDVTWVNQPMVYNGLTLNLEPMVVFLFVAGKYVLSKALGTSYSSYSLIRNLFTLVAVTYA